MSARHRGLVCLAAITAAIGGCNLVLGIEDLSQSGGVGGGGEGGGDASTTHTSSHTGTTHTTSTGTGGAGGDTGATGGGGAAQGGGGSGGGTCTTGAECPVGKPACIGGSCVKPACGPSGPIFDIFTSNDIGGNALGSNTVVVVAYGDNDVAVAANDATAGALLLRAVHSDGTTSPISTFPLGGKYGKFFDGSGTADKISVEGQLGDQMGQVFFDVDIHGEPQNPTFNPFDTPQDCGTPNEIHDFALTHTDAAVKYAITCADTVGGKKIYVGGSDETAFQVDKTGTDAPYMHVESYAVTNAGDRLLFTGSGDNIQFWRAGTTVADLQTHHQTMLSTNADAAGSGINVVPLQTGFFLMGGEFRLDPPAFGNLYSGTTTDPSTLSTVPPGGLTLQKAFGADVLDFFGDMSAFRASTTSLFASTNPNKASVALDWFAVTGELAAFGLPIFTVADTDSMSVQATSVAPADGHVLIAWTEVDAGVTRVRGVWKSCGY